MQLSDSGLTVWYGTSDAPAPPEQASAETPVSLTVGVQPAHPANGVDVAYRMDQGPELEMHATLTRTDYSQNQQFFRADFPPLSSGTLVEYAPVVRHAGRRIDFRQSGRYPSSFFVANSERKCQAPNAPTGPPDLHPYRLEHITRGDLTLVKNYEVVGETPEGIRLNLQVSGGTYRGKICGQACAGSGDWLTIRRDGIGIVDAKVTIKTNDGATLLLIGSGTIDLGRDGYHNAAAGRYPSMAPLVDVMRFLASDPRYAWLLRLQCMAIGYGSEERVCYDIYGVHSLCT
jgi:hypothetical protein